MKTSPPIDSIKQHFNSIHPIADLNTILETQNSLGFPLPDLLKDLYFYVGNGGFGPQGSALIGLTGGEEYLGYHLETLYADYRRWTDAKYYINGQSVSQWPDRLLIAFIWPCTIYTCLDCSHPEIPVYIYDTNLINGKNLHIPRPIIKHKNSFREWLTAVASGEDLESEMNQLISQTIENYYTHGS